MSETLKMIVRELPRTMGELNHQLLYGDLKQVLKEVEEMEQRLQQASREAYESAKDAFRRGWEQGKSEAEEIALQMYGAIGFEESDRVGNAIAAMEYNGESK